MNDLPEFATRPALSTWHPDSWFDPVVDSGPQPRHAKVEDDADGDRSFIRPFIVTEGRTQPQQDGLQVETLVQALPAASTAPLWFERRRIIELCQEEPLALAEIAASLRVPLGVARVLVADLAASQFVSLYEPSDLPIHVIERIRDLVQAL